MVEPLRHRQTKGAETDMLDLTPPRHVSTLPRSGALNRASRKRGPFHVRAGQKTPPVIGFGAPVVVAKEIGKPRRERKAQ